MATRRRRIVRWSLFALAAAACVDACAIEPYAVEKRTHTVSTKVRSKLTVAHLSDLHTHGFGRRE